MNSLEAHSDGDQVESSSEDDSDGKRRKRLPKSLIEQTVTAEADKPLKKERPTLPWLKAESKPKAEEVETKKEADEVESEPPLNLSSAEANVDEERAPIDGTLSPEEVELAWSALLEANQLERSAEIDNSATESTVNQLMEEVGEAVTERHLPPEQAADTVLIEHGLIDEADLPDKRDFEDGGEIYLSHEHEAELAGGGGGGNGELPPENGGGDESEEQPPQRRGSLNIPFRPPLKPMTQAETSSQQSVELLDQGNPAVAALIGGIIGYFIGRRRGRIRTEKKLLPIQKKLESQVNDLNWQLKKAEKKVREAVRQRAERVMPIAETVIEKPASIRKENTPNYEQIKPDRVEAPAASLLHGVLASEQIGHMLMSAETLQPDKKPTKEPKEEIAKLEKLIDNQNVETMNRPALLAISEKIIVEGSSLRQIYETHLIGEKGLRRLVAEHLRGGDLKKALRKEITEREIDFERDPVMRDLAGASVGAAATHNPTLQQMIRRAEQRLPADNEQLAYLRARADYENKQRVEAEKQRQTLDVLFGGIILVLLSLVIFLLLAHH